MTRSIRFPRLMATAALGAILFGSAASPLAAKEDAATTAATAAHTPEIGSYGFDAKGMDTTVLPGNDFYAYANGTREKASAIPADKSNNGMITSLADLSQKRTQEIRSEETTSELQSL